MGGENHYSKSAVSQVELTTFGQS